MAVTSERVRKSHKNRSYRRTPPLREHRTPIPFSAHITERLSTMKEEEKDVIHYIDHLVAAYPEALNVWDAGKLFSPEYQNIAIHCATAGAYADTFTDLLGITGDEKHDIVLAALLHDWFKVTEIQMQDEELDREKRLSLSTLNRIKDLDTHALQALGISDHVAHLAGQNVPESIEGPQSTEAKIIWFIDAMLRDQNAIATFARFPIIHEHIPLDHLDRRERRNHALDEAYAKRFDGMRYYTLQGNLGVKVGRDLAELLARRHGLYLEHIMDDPEIRLPIFLEDQLKSKAKQFTSPATPAIQVFSLT